MSHPIRPNVSSEIVIPSGGVLLEGELKIPSGARGIVIFAHGSGSSRFSPRNQSVAAAIRQSGLGTLLFDLLTRREEEGERLTRHLRFNIDLLTTRLLHATNWLRFQPGGDDLGIGYFGASTGAAAALAAAAQLGKSIGAVVSRGGRPDLAAENLPRVQAPTLLIVGGNDDVVIELNKQAFAKLNCIKELSIIPGATHLFEERGALEQVAGLATAWFSKYLVGSRSSRKAS